MHSNEFTKFKTSFKSAESKSFYLFWLGIANAVIVEDTLDTKKRERESTKNSGSEATMERVLPYVY